MKTSILLLALFATLTTANAHLGSISGRIEESTTGLELDGARIALFSENGLENAPLKTTVADALGHFSFADLASGSYFLKASFIGFRQKEAFRIEVRDNETAFARIQLEPSAVDLADIEVTSRHDVFQNFSKIDLASRPDLTTSQDVLKLVPGLFIAQHAGGGKAEQLFLRGFDIDHGTDVALAVDGLPVNMPSHAHGQGYADLHFLIPELIENVDYRKGPHSIDAGDFATAGAVRLETADGFDENLVKIEVGQFGSKRALGIFDLLGEKGETSRRHAFIAAESVYSDGYFDASQGFRRANVFGKLTSNFAENQRIEASISAFKSSWDASGQIPERAILAKKITRFGAIDATEGGQTSRINLNLEHTRVLSEKAVWKNQLFLTDYRFSLFSNFTFFKIDSINGDQIHQKEGRKMFGFNSNLTFEKELFGKTWTTEAGLFLRQDAVRDIELSRTKNRRELLKPLSLGDIDESSAGIFVSEKAKLSEKISLSIGGRIDLFQFGFEDFLTPAYAPKRIEKAVFSPKTSFVFEPNRRIQVAASFSQGFHSNDARVVAAQNGLQILPKATGLDLGLTAKLSPKVLANLTFWGLDLEQEFVYVGDEAIVEPSGKTRRMGLDFSMRGQLFRRVFLDFDGTFSDGFSKDDPEDENKIPLAPRLTATGGLSFESKKGWFGSLRFRGLGDRPANEDGSLTAQGYLLFDGQMGWKKGAFSIGLMVQNLTNRAWNEAQFATESRLFDEKVAVEEIHFTPGTPLSIKAFLQVRF